MPKYVVKVLINMTVLRSYRRDGYDGVGAENCSRMIEDGELDKRIAQRYSGWKAN